ncbi:MAG: hypothetical protein ABIO16_11130 [Nocardioides sp.]
MRRIPPPAGDLRSVVAGSLELTLDTVRALETTPDLLDATKVVGEALLLLRATRTVAQDSAGWRHLYDATTPHARPADLAMRVCRDPARALETAFAHIQLTDLGDPDPALDAPLDLALSDEPTGPAPYVVPELQRQWLRDVRRGAPDPIARDRLLHASSLARPVDLLRCSTQDVYDLTHAVMHGTDLGLWPLSAPRDEADLAADLDALLGIALGAENFDLTTELLWAWPMLRLAWTPAADLALDTVLTLHRKHGYLPGPGLDPESGPDATEIRRTSYHATLVLGILAAAILRAGDLPDRAQPDRRDALAPMRLAVDLRRASDRADLAEVRRLLQHAVDLDLADGRAVAQSVALLRRTIAACTG